LRQQLIVAARTVKKPKVTRYERGLLVILARLVPRWRDALLVVKPDTRVGYFADPQEIGPFMPPSDRHDAALLALARK